MYLDDTHAQLINSEEEYVRQMYFVVARTLAPEGLRITRKEAADILGISKKKLQMILNRFMGECVEELRETSTRQKNLMNFCVF